MNITSEQWDQLYKLIETATKDILVKLSSHISENKYIMSYIDFPISVDFDTQYKWPKVKELSIFNGLAFGKNDYSYSDYSTFISTYHEDGKVYIRDIEGYSSCVSFITENSNILPLIWYRDKEEDIDIALCLLLGKIIERYVSTLHTLNFKDDCFYDVYTTVTNTYFLDVLEFNICIPILFIEFNDDHISINNNLSIEKMSDELIRSKHFIGYYDSRFEKTVLDCATHMLVIKNFTLENKKLTSKDSFSNWRIFPIDIIDSVFAGIRVLTSFPTGYAQFIVLPINNWIDTQCKGELLGLAGSKIKGYPEYFLEYYWQKPHSFITSDCGNNIALLVNNMINNKHNAIKLACNRLNRSMLRNSEEDTILDAIIGLEVLLSDNDKGEITYKLSSRMATLTTLTNNHSLTPLDVRKEVSQIYRYRSEIVHSKKRKTSNYIFRMEREKEIKPVEAAIRYLCIAIEILVSNPKYLDSSKIDELMMKKLQ